jgi:hypothetical protein
MKFKLQFRFQLHCSAVPLQAPFAHDLAIIAQTTLSVSRLLTSAMCLGNCYAYIGKPSTASI